MRSVTISDRRCGVRLRAEAQRRVHFVHQPLQRRGRAPSDRLRQRAESCSRMAVPFALHQGYIVFITPGWVLILRVLHHPTISCFVHRGHSLPWRLAAKKYRAKLSFTMATLLAVFVSRSSIPAPKVACDRGKNFGATALNRRPRSHPGGTCNLAPRRAGSETAISGIAHGAGRSRAAGAEPVEQRPARPSYAPADTAGDRTLNIRRRLSAHRVDAVEFRRLPTNSVAPTMHHRDGKLRDRSALPAAGRRHAPA